MSGSSDNQGCWRILWFVPVSVGAGAGSFFVFLSVLSVSSVLIIHQDLILVNFFVFFANGLLYHDCVIIIILTFSRLSVIIVYRIIIFWSTYFLFFLKIFLTFYFYGIIVLVKLV